MVVTAILCLIDGDDIERVRTGRQVLRGYQGKSRRGAAAGTGNVDRVRSRTPVLGYGAEGGKQSLGAERDYRRFAGQTRDRNGNLASVGIAGGNWLQPAGADFERKGIAAAHDAERYHPDGALYVNLDGVHSGRYIRYVNNCRKSAGAVSSCIYAGRCNVLRTQAYVCQGLALGETVTADGYLVADSSVVL